MRRDLYYGDNLQILRDRSEFADECVDLIYLDPPFNSNASYNMLFREAAGEAAEAQIEAFDDTWHWGIAAEAAFDDVMQGHNLNAAALLQAMRRFLGDNDMMAYLAMMAVRLLELHRVLKETGSLYLHCDSTASHYLKLVLDSVFGPEHYRNELVWRRATSHSDAKRFGRITDRILFYSKSDDYVWNGDAVRTGMSEAEIRKSFPRTDEIGRYRGENFTGPSHGQTGGESAKPWKGYDVLARGRVWSAPKVGKGAYADYIAEHFIENYADIEGVHDRLEALDEAGLILHPKDGVWPSLKRYADSSIGHAAQDLILEPIGFTNFSRGDEWLGYPTQKRLGLLEPLIKASSNEGDVVLDPFCGCGTAIHAAEKLGRQWAGIDVTHLAINLVEHRMRDAFTSLAGGYRVLGVPRDLESARKLARENAKEFERWAVACIEGARPYKLQGADQGIDGIAYFREDTRQYRRIILSVKGGKHVGVAMVRDLCGVLEREQAALGLLISLTEPTRPMRQEAASAGFYQSENKRFPKVQIVTIESLLDGEKPELPPIDVRANYRKTPREKPDNQPPLL